MRTHIQEYEDTDLIAYVCVELLFFNHAHESRELFQVVKRMYLRHIYQYEGIDVWQVQRFC